MTSWTHAQCEACWIQRHGVSNDGEMLIGRPVVVRDADATVCCFCGAPTIVGIYVRHNPNEVKYCHHE